MAKYKVTVWYKTGSGGKGREKEINTEDYKDPVFRRNRARTGIEGAVETIAQEGIHIVVRSGSAESNKLSVYIPPQKIFSIFYERITEE